MNHRFLELAFRLPEELRALEPQCRDIVSAAVKRGKVDCTLRVATAPGATAEGVLDEAALRELAALDAGVRAVFRELRPLSVSEILRWPGVMKEPERTALAEPALAAFGEAVAALAGARRREGERIVEALRQRLDAIERLVTAAAPLLDGAQQRYREKLEERLRRFDVQVQPERLEQEVVLVVQRADVSEEVDRLRSHTAELAAILGRDEPVGRRLDFLIQELNREANTFASKVQDETLTRTAVDLKVLIEQMREQVQNLE